MTHSSTTILGRTAFIALRNASLPLKLAVSALALGSVVACGGGNKAEAPKATQVIAKVNDTELSVHQLNFALQGVGNLPPDRLLAVKKDVLNRLVEQEIAVQEALKKKLDREPAVQQQLEASRRDILMKAQLQRIGAGVAIPDQVAIDKFFVENPALFQKRKTYRFAEISLPGIPTAWSELEKALLPVKTIAEAAEVLKTRKIELPIAQNVNRGSEDLPIEIATKLVNVKDGEVVIYSRPPGIVVAQILSSTAAPVDEKQAKPVIERFLQNKGRTEAIQSEMKRLKDEAKVTYLGEFAADAKAPAPAAPVAPTPKTDDANTIEKGIKGLK
jgi:EpsD family peptidyl-prolyl cis-trans isomerase